MILNTGDNWEPENDDVKKWVELYPAVDVPQELRAMEGWVDANPTRRKTKRGVKRFVNSWLSRAQDKGGSPMAQSKALAMSGECIVRTRDMTTLDYLTDNFTGEAHIREFFIQKHGQCFENGRRITA